MSGFGRAVALGLPENSDHPFVRRAAVQGERHDRNGKRPADSKGLCDGSISWMEHLEAWNAYAARYGRGQSASRIDERGGFGYLELTALLGHEPATWLPRKQAPGE